MPDFIVQGYDIDDFSGALSSDGAAGDTTGTQFVGGSTTLAAGATTQQLTITDDDNVLEDAFQETGSLSVLTQDVTLGSTTFLAGSNIELEFSLTTTEGITFWIGRIGTGTSNSGENELIFTSEPLTPGQTYTFTTSGDAQSTPFSTICFLKGTMIDTPAGPCPIEDLRPGDTVLTRDHGPQLVQWIGSRTLALWQSPQARRLAPIRIRRGALGKDAPSCDLLVSPQHRIAISDWRAELLFGSASVLVPARALLNDTTITVDRSQPSVRYFHLLLPCHALVRANDHWAESLLAGPEARAALNADQLAELDMLVPDWDLQATCCAIPTIRTQEARVLAPAPSVMIA